MITHEEARKYAHNIITEDTTMKHHRSARELYGYANQQEKVGELLKEKNRQIKLLKSRLTYDIFDPSNDDVIENNSQALEECGIKIAQLEKELGL